MLQMPVEKALEWAYRQELPKAHTGSRLALPGLQGNKTLQTMATLGVPIDHLNAFGVVPDFSASDDPHPAAIALHHLVMSIDDLLSLGFERVDVLEDFSIPPGEGRARVDAASAKARSLVLERGDDGAWRLKGGIAEMMRRRAILPDWSDEWRIDELALAYETARSDGRLKWYRRDKVACAWDERGRPRAFQDVEIDGWDATARRPFADAYNRVVLKPDPTAAIAARIEWRVWRAALDVLAEMAQEAVIHMGDGPVTMLDLGLRLLGTDLLLSPWDTPRVATETCKVLKNTVAMEKPSLGKTTIKQHYVKKKKNA